MMTTKKQELDELFIEWQQKQENESNESFEETKGNTTNITKGHFCKDGIICEEKFEKEETKILFISNESNDDSNNKETSRVESFCEYYEKGKDNWTGKMRERICALYKVIVEDYTIEEYKVAQNFAFMNLNKRSGVNSIKDKNESENHIEKYVELYSDEIKKEIEIINPDIIVWLGYNTYDMDLHIKYLGAYKKDDRIYMTVNSKEIPILRMCHTSRGQYLTCEYDENFSNKILGKLATVMRDELKRYNLK